MHRRDFMRHLLGGSAAALVGVSCLEERGVLTVTNGTHHEVMVSIICTPTLAYAEFYTPATGQKTHAIPKQSIS